MRTGGRSLMTRLAALLLCAAVLSCSVAKETFAASGVITGKNGWYFTDFDSAPEDYRGTDLYTADQLQRILQSFIYIRDVLTDQGIEFVVFLAPNKERIYSEYMPDSYGAIAPYSRIEQVYDILKDEIDVIYPEEMLMEAKEKYPYETYYKTDSHWNGIGTYLCSKLLMEELGYEMPELEDLTVSAYPTDDMDCSQLLGRSLPDVGYTVNGYEGAEPSQERVFICGDSFGQLIADCIRPVTNDSFIVHRDIYEPEMLQINGVTVMVYEVLERFMDAIPILF